MLRQRRRRWHKIKPISVWMYRFCRVPVFIVIHRVCHRVLPPPPPSNLNSWVLYYMHVILCYLITIPMCPHPHSLLLGRRPPVCSLNTVHTVHYTRLCTSPHWVPLSCLCVSLVTLLADITTWPLRHSRNNWNQLAPVSVKCWALYSCSNQHPPPPLPGQRLA